MPEYTTNTNPPPNDDNDREELRKQLSRELVDAAGAKRILDVNTRQTVISSGIPVVMTANGGNVYRTVDVLKAARERAATRRPRRPRTDTAKDHG